jgi:lipoprotein-anchoring transpeptidase ErfK/SrfK
LPPKLAETNAAVVVPKEEPAPKPRIPPGARPVRDAFEAQLALARRAIASGPVDGAMGSQTRAALQVFQQYEGLPTTGLLDNATRDRLWIEGEAYTSFVVTQQDLDALHPIPSTWLGKSQVDRLGYETILEMVAEASHSHPLMVRKLNPGIDWGNVSAGMSIRIPKAEYPSPKSKAALVRISLSGKNLRAYDTDGVLLCFFPCSIAQRVDKRPVGELRVEVAIKDPDYTFNPDVFPESAEAKELKRKLRLPPGPNNPVGVAWIGLNRSGYGIHGTPKPEDVGRTESHGCFRLANWNAEYLRQMVNVGTPVSVEP